MLHKLLKVDCIQKTDDTHIKTHSNDVHCSFLFMKILVHINCWNSLLTPFIFYYKFPALWHNRKVVVNGVLFCTMYIAAMVYSG